MSFESDSFIENFNAQIPYFWLSILMKFLTSKFILQKAQIYYASKTNSIAGILAGAVYRSISSPWNPY